MKKYIKKYRLQILIILVGIILAILYNFFAVDEQILKNKNMLKRQNYDGEDYRVKLYVEGIDEKKLPIDIEVRKREYDEKMLEEIFDKCMEILPSKILGENKSLSEIRYKLNFVKYIDEYGVDVLISPEDSELIEFNGGILNEDLKDAKDTYLNIRLGYGDIKQEYQIQVSVLPSDKSDISSLVKSFKRYIEKEDEGTKTKEYMSLPSTWENRELKYIQEKNYNALYILLFSIILAVLLFLNEKHKKKMENLRVERQSLLEYPEIVSKFIIFIEAGLSIRNVWEKIVIDYEKGKTKNIYVYEEMKKAHLRMKSGIHEAIVYKDFARNMKLRQYTKFISILEQNRRAGLSNIRELLNYESKNAWEERMQLAKRQGKEAETKMLIPLFLMLLIVLIIVVAPAMLNIY